MGNRRCDTILTQNRVAVTGFLGAYLGYRKALKVTNKEHAEARAQAIYDLIREGNYTALTELEKNRHVTFAQFLEKFRQDYHNWDEYTWKASSGLLSKLVKEFGDVPLNAITTHQLEGYLARLTDIPHRVEGEAEPDDRQGERYHHDVDEWDERDAARESHLQRAG